MKILAKFDVDLYVTFSNFQSSPSELNNPQKFQS